MERQFKGVWIPANIWLNSDLTPFDKCLLAEIDSFSTNGKFYFKTNDTIALEMNVSIGTVKRSFKRLLDLDLIENTGNTRQKIIRLKTNRQKVQNESDKVQNVPSLGTNCATTNKDTNKDTNTFTIIYPFDDLEFIKTWKIWLDERKQKKTKKYTERGEQAALKKLAEESNYNVNLAIEMIHNAIARGWQGIYPIKNDKRNNKKTGFDTGKYSDYLNSL